jgi:hypothetical protein
MVNFKWPQMLVSFLLSLLACLFIFIFLKANGTETYAIHQKEDFYKLYGYKWFSSATDSDCAITLARVKDPNSLAV